MDKKDSNAVKKSSKKRISRNTAIVEKIKNPDLATIREESLMELVENNMPKDPMTKEFFFLLSSYIVDRLDSKNINYLEKSAFEQYIIDSFKDVQEEKLLYVMLDKELKLIKKSWLLLGSKSIIIVSDKAIYTEAVSSQAQYVVLAHNHPSGCLKPSEDDLKSTKQIYNQLKTFGVVLLEHYIVANGKIVKIIDQDDVLLPKKYRSK